MAVGDQPPYECEAQPGQQEIHGEHQQRPSPLGVHQRREDVLRIAIKPVLPLSSREAKEFKERERERFLIVFFLIRGVNSTWRYRRRRFATFPCTTLQSPCLNTTLLRTLLELNLVWRYLESNGINANLTVRCKVQIFRYIRATHQYSAVRKYLRHRT